MSAPSHYVAILGSTNKAEIHVLEIGFPSWWLLIRKIDRVVQITAAYVSARENTAMHIRTFGTQVSPRLTSQQEKTPLTLSLRARSSISVDRIHYTKNVYWSNHQFTTIPGCEARGSTLYTKPCYISCALIINHQTLLFNKSLDHCISACHTINPYRTTDFCQYITSELICLREGR